MDNTANTFQVVNAGAASTSGYGTYAVTAGGVWTYTLNNSNATVQALNTSGTLTDTFTVLTTDGTSQVVTVTIAGTNDAPVAVADSIYTNSASLSNLPDWVLSSNDTDVDGSSLSVTAAVNNVGLTGVSLANNLVSAANIATGESLTYTISDGSLTTLLELLATKF